MSDTSRTERLVREWLGDSEYPLSTEPVINAVLDSVSDVGQETALRSGWNVRRFASAGLVAALIVAVVGFALLSRPEPAIGPATSPSSSPSVVPTPTTSPSPSSGSFLPAGVRTIDMGEETWALAVDDQSVWVQVSESDVGRIDKGIGVDTGVRVHEVPAIQFEGRDLWALDIGTGIVRLDPLNGTILKTIPGIQRVLHRRRWNDSVGERCRPLS